MNTDLTDPDLFCKPDVYSYLVKRNVCTATCALCGYAQVAVATEAEEWVISLSYIMMMFKILLKFLFKILRKYYSNIIEKWAQEYRKGMNQSFSCPEECHDCLLLGYFLYILFTNFIFHMIRIPDGTFSRKSFELNIV